MIQAERLLNHDYGVLVEHLDEVLSILQKIDFLRTHQAMLMDNPISDNVIQQLVQVYIQTCDEAVVRKYQSAPYGEHRFKKLQKFFSNQVNDKVRKKLFPTLTFTSSRQGWLCCKGYATTSLSLANLVQISEDYNAIRDERNQSNHARKDGETTLTEISDKIRTSLKHIKSLA